VSCSAGDGGVEALGARGPTGVRLVERRSLVMTLRLLPRILAVCSRAVLLIGPDAGMGRRCRVQRLLLLVPGEAGTVSVGLGTWALRAGAVVTMEAGLFDRQGHCGQRLAQTGNAAFAGSGRTRWSRGGWWLKRRRLTLALSRERPVPRIFLAIGGGGGGGGRGADSAMGW